MKVNLLLDIDGIICDFYVGFAEYLNRVYSANLPLDEEPQSYTISEWGSKCSSINIDEAVLGWINNHGFDKAPAYSGAKEFVEQLNKLANVFVVTARIGDFKQKFGNQVVDKIKTDTVDWFKDNNIPVDTIYFDHNKVDFCKDNAISILIEDKLDTALKGAKEGIHSILMNRRWNEHPNRHKVYRVFNYEEILNLVRKLSNG